MPIGRGLHPNGWSAAITGSVSLKGPLPTLIVFARTPVPGAVKTRFTPPCTPEQAAKLASLITRHSVRQAARYWPGTLRVAVWPNPRHRVFQDLEGELGIPVELQSAGDLGDKMLHALKAETARGAPAAVIGTDVPHCPPALIERTYRLLRAGHDVLGPSHDGGYYLIGLQHATRELFCDVTWGSDQLCAITRSRAAALGIEFQLLDALVDLDTWADLVRVKDAFPLADQWIKDLGLTPDSFSSVEPDR